MISSPNTEQPNLDIILINLFTPNSGTKWAEPSEENFAYVRNLEYLTPLFQSNPKAFISLVRARFPKIPEYLLKSIFTHPKTTTESKPPILLSPSSATNTKKPEVQESLNSKRMHFENDSENLQESQLASADNSERLSIYGRIKFNRGSEERRIK